MCSKPRFSSRAKNVLAINSQRTSNILFDKRQTFIIIITFSNVSETSCLKQKINSYLIAGLYTPSEPLMGNCLYESVLMRQR